ncbi:MULTISPECIES: hypothetical protein [unclassified Mycoplasma]|uniref:hypothetical protein n=1 Tax=unclassified Mycoplasma TaxID=2683645 RepID=UPI00211CA19B|nr:MULTISPECIES: hypothetical protein [unclassified Mycoplasma]UUM20068.1 hypothetical protein NPA11_01420 [Mycoplasma sp. 1578d]UUM25048.1 hypothetical protein NPA12_01395 [Mycoplasma sp. 3686d]
MKKKLLSSLLLLSSLTAGFVSVACSKQENSVQNPQPDPQKNPPKTENKPVTPNTDIEKPNPSKQTPPIKDQKPDETKNPGASDNQPIKKEPRTESGEVSEPVKKDGLKSDPITNSSGSSKNSTIENKNLTIDISFDTREHSNKQQGQTKFIDSLIKIFKFIKSHNYDPELKITVNFEHQDTEKTSDYVKNFLFKSNKTYSIYDLVGDHRFEIAYSETPIPERKASQNSIEFFKKNFETIKADLENAPNTFNPDDPKHRSSETGNGLYLEYTKFFAEGGTKEEIQK